MWLILPTHQRRSGWELFECVVQGGEKCSDGFDCFVAHVGDAEGFALQFSVAAIDHKAVFFSEALDPGGDVYVAIVFHASERE